MAHLIGSEDPIIVRPRGRTDGGLVRSDDGRPEGRQLRMAILSVLNLPPNKRVPSSLRHVACA